MSFRSFAAPLGEHCPGAREIVAFVEKENTVWISRAGLRARIIASRILRLVNAFTVLRVPDATFPSNCPEN